MLPKPDGRLKTDMATAKKKKPTSMEESPWVKVNKEVTQSPDLRLKLISEIAKKYGANVFTLITSFKSQTAQMNDSDAEMLESMIAAEHQGGKLILIVNSPGGQALAAERIVNVCRAYSEGQFEVIVPHMAKSAATMICFGASKIHMSKTAELGPVDPQISYIDADENEKWISAEEYVRSYENLLKEACSGKPKRIEPYLQQLNRYDARYVERLKSVQKLSEDISIKLLKTGMMKSVAIKEIKRKINVFLSQLRTRTHGRMINHDEAAKCGLQIESIDLQSNIWNYVWELFVRSDWVVSHGCSSIIESQRSSVSR